MAEQPLRVLVVEDHPDTALVLRLYLKQSGHAVLSARTIKQAADVLATSDCDVLLSDIALEDGTGWELLDGLGPSTPPYAIAMSGFGTAADVSRSKSVGYRHHLVKPVDPDLLDQLLQEARQEKDGA